MSNYEELLNKIINGEDISNYSPQSRFEQILKDKYTGVETLTPVNVGEALLIQVLGSSSGGGGSSSSKDMLQARVDATNSCEYLMYRFKGTDVSFLSKLNTSNVTTMANMFGYCYNITTVSFLDTSNVTNMENMFDNCENITSCPDFDTKNVTNMRGMFNYCKNLTTVPLFDTSKVTNMSNMFSSCDKLTTIPALNASSATTLNGIFYSSKALKSILMYGMKVKFDISASTKFEREDLVTILNNLGTVTTATTLTMGSTNLAKLTDTDKEIATNKGWTLA